MTTAVVNIKIDHQKCRFSLFDPTGCKQCLEACPVCVLGCIPAEKREINKPPLVYRLSVTYPELCNACLACVRVCPFQALEVSTDVS